MAGKIIADIIEAPYDSIRMNVGNVTVLTANGSGITYTPTSNLNVNLGNTANITVGTLTANGIKFPATQVTSADGNTLDDYEEGTWTPTDTSGAGLTLTIGGTSVYIKIGNIVCATAAVTYPSTANTSQSSIGGLPFATSNYNSANGGGFGATINYTNYTTTHITMLLLHSATNALPHSSSGITNAALSTKVIRYTAIYQVS